MSVLTVASAQNGQSSDASSIAFGGPIGRTHIDTHGIVVWLIIGAIAGWLAGKLVKGGGYGLMGDIVVGIVGALIGGWLAGVLGITVGGGLIASIITANVGAIILIVIVRAIRRT